MLILGLLALLQMPTSGVLIDRRLAEDLPAAVGDTLFIETVATGGVTRPFVVEGIFERAADPSRISRNDYEIRMHLPDLESMLPTRDRVDRFAVRVASDTDLGATATWVETLAFGTSVWESDRIADETSTTFRVVSRFHDAIGLVTLLASGIFLLCLMIVRVDERRRDVGTLRLIGISRATVLRVVLLEAVVVAGVASALGAVLGIALTAVVNWYYAGFYDTELRFAIVSSRILLISIGLGVLLGLAAGGLAAWRVATVPVQRLGER